MTQPDSIRAEEGISREGGESRTVMADDELLLCSCGYDRHHPMVSAELEYSMWGTFWLTMMGVSAVPLRAKFRCRRCQQRFDFTEDPDELKTFL